MNLFYVTRHHAIVYYVLDFMFYVMIRFSKVMPLTEFSKFFENSDKSFRNANLIILS